MGCRSSSCSTQRRTAASGRAVETTALATGYIAQHWGLRPEPFLLGLAYVALDLGLSTLALRETHGWNEPDAPHTTAT